MSIIPEVTVSWLVSPRIINMPAPFGEPTIPLTVEDLNDTLQDIEANEEGIACPKLRDASGKEAGVVALTIQLLNAQIKFEDTGIPRVCQISGGNLFAIDKNGDDMCPIAYNSNVIVGYAQSTAATMIAAIAEWTQTEKDDVFSNISSIKAKTNSLPFGIVRGEHLDNFPFLMTDATTDKPKVGLSVTTKLSKNGGAFENTINQVEEIGSGLYKISLTDIEMDADTVILKAEAPEANQMTLVFKTSE